MGSLSRNAYPIAFHLVAIATHPLTYLEAQLAFEFPAQSAIAL
ncbi:MAG TPA: hypothetical protein V6D16_03120 [Candidatus Obscuribacterales bacterium]